MRRRISASSREVDEAVRREYDQKKHDDDRRERDEEPADPRPLPRRASRRRRPPKRYAQASAYDPPQHEPRRRSFDRASSQFRRVAMTHASETSDATATTATATIPRTAGHDIGRSARPRQTASHVERRRRPTTARCSRCRSRPRDEIGQPSRRVALRPSKPRQRIACQDQQARPSVRMTSRRASGSRRCASRWR